MAKFAETFLIEYLNRQGFAVAQSVRSGVREWDVLAISGSTGTIRARHYEIQVSYDPVGFLSESSAKRRNAAHVDRDMESWFTSKYERSEIREIRSHFFNGQWEYWFVHGVVREARELDWLRARGVQLVAFGDLLRSLCATHPRNLPFTAEGKDIVEIVRNMLRSEQIVELQTKAARGS